MKTGAETRGMWPRAKAPPEAGGRVEGSSPRVFGESTNLLTPGLQPSGTFSKTMRGSHLPPLVDRALTEGRGHVFRVVSGPAWNTGLARSGHSVDAGRVNGRGPLLLGVHGVMHTPSTARQTYVAACPFVLLERQIIKVSLAVTWSLQNVLILE